mmetsp:Transcript_8224/g.19306  ORF Transcript_8224/g.19306 Transcript_8224/m.19306 type:complete len:120 (-) Transcript_8224:712-1071(-)
MSEGCQCKLTRGKPAAPKEVSPPASAAPPEKADAPKKKAKKAALAKAVSKKSTKSATFMGATTKATKHEASTKKKKELHPPRAHPRRDRSDMSGHQKWDALAASAGLGKKGRGYQYLNV